MDTAAIMIHNALMVSPRDKATEPNAKAPTTATAIQMACLVMEAIAIPLSCPGGRGGLSLPRSPQGAYRDDGDECSRGRDCFCARRAHSCACKSRHGRARAVAGR